MGKTNKPRDLNTNPIKNYRPRCNCRVQRRSKTCYTRHFLHEERDTSSGQKRLTMKTSCEGGNAVFLEERKKKKKRRRGKEETRRKPQMRQACYRDAQIGNWSRDPLLATKHGQPPSTTITTVT